MADRMEKKPEPATPERFARTLETYAASIVERARPTLESVIGASGQPAPDAAADRLLERADTLLKTMAARVSDLGRRRGTAGESAPPANSEASVLSLDAATDERALLLAVLLDAAVQVAAGHPGSGAEWAEEPAARQMCVHIGAAELGITAWDYATGVDTLRSWEKERTRDFCAGVVGVHENERGRIACDIHDVLAQGLAGARYRVDTARRILAEDQDQAAAELRETQELIEYALAHVRDIIFDLRPVTLDRFGLRTAIQSYIDRLGRTHTLRVSFEGDGYARHLSPEGESCLFRTVQEAFSTLVLPQGCPRADVRLGVGDDAVTLVIETQACESDEENAEQATDSVSAFNELLMRRRVEVLGGTLSIERRGDRSAKLVVKAPVKNGGA